MSYLNPSRKQIEELKNLKVDGPIQMINLLKYKSKVEGTDLTGEEQYAEYGKAAAPFLQESGAKFVYSRKFLASVIGPEALEWDKMLIVEYPNKESFFKMLKSPGYPSALRDKALADSRLIFSINK